MSIAIVYMAKEFNWSSTVAGLIFTAFLIGYLATQIIGGALADRFGGKIVLGTGMTFFFFLVSVLFAYCYYIHSTIFHAYSSHSIHYSQN